jgi:hypothetical protein
MAAKLAATTKSAVSDKATGGIRWRQAYRPRPPSRRPAAPLTTEILFMTPLRDLGGADVDLFESLKTSW